jgi:hypothetical protein
MNRQIFIGLGVLTVAVSMALSAQEPDAARTTGRVLVLVNERTMQGDIQRDGDQYRVRRSVGETTIPADNVLCLCQTLEEAYAFLRSRANLNDADERLRLARWCQLHGLRSQALAEVTAAVDLRPSSKECKRLLQSLERATAAGTAESKDGAKPGKDTAAPAPVEISSESIGQFISKVQPILMNTCASCHVGDKAGTFKLARATEGGTVSRRATQQNLAAVLARITLARPEASPFLVKAISVHGEATQPPIKNRQAAPYRALEDWVRATIADNPQLLEHAGSSLSPAPRLESSQVTPNDGARSGFADAKPTSTPPTTAVPAAPVDPFDPLLFNAENHKSKPPDRDR